MEEIIKCVWPEGMWLLLVLQPPWVVFGVGKEKEISTILVDYHPQGSELHVLLSFKMSMGNCVLLMMLKGSGHKTTSPPKHTAEEMEKGFVNAACYGFWFYPSMGKNFFDYRPINHD